MINFDSVSFSYDEGRQILSDINISIEKGEWVAVIGSNGSGKSTFARLINGLLLPTSGKVLVDEMDTAEEKQLQQIRQKVAFVFQNPDNQLVASTVEDDVAFGPENLSVPPAEIAERVRLALKMTGLEKYAKTPVYDLSGGEKQRVAIAGALAMASSYIVLDEPTSMLDPVLRCQVLQVLQQLHREMGMGLIYITNVMDEVYLADRVIVLNKGNFIMQGTPTEIFSQREKLIEIGLGIPSAQEICLRLFDMGLLERNDLYNVEEIAAELCK
ncbi:MAG: energy-coupling factor transporter ATPase [Firmicutes bacterium]|nr:energy-coupling factor transporter ATPase [Bacillota bacterium]